MDTSAHLSDELLSDYLDGRLGRAEAAQAELHLRGCPHCAAALDSLRATVGLLRTLPPVTLPRDFTLGPAAQPVGALRPRVLARLEVWTRSAAAIAAALLVVLVSLDLLGFGSPAPAARPIAQAPAAGPAAEVSAPAATAVPAAKAAPAAQPAAPASPAPAAPASAPLAAPSDTATAAADQVQPQAAPAPPAPAPTAEAPAGGDRLRAAPAEEAKQAFARPSAARDLQPSGSLLRPFELALAGLALTLAVASLSLRALRRRATNLRR